jgi:hypothetical protein
MPPISERFDFVNAWSAIHYVAHSLELLARFVEYWPRVILLVNHPVSRDHGFVRGQRSDGYFCPAHVLSLGEVEDALRLSVGAFRGSDHFEFNVDNFPPAYRVGRCANLLPADLTASGCQIAPSCSRAMRRADQASLRLGTALCRERQLVAGYSYKLAGVSAGGRQIRRWRSQRAR